ncbi:hypothetical protein GGI24_006873 [Coemansia furcata]|nr:hypothetical protein GGI24_006873 [Coemansia furcata]
MDMRRLAADTDESASIGLTEDGAGLLSSVLPSNTLEFSEYSGDGGHGECSGDGGHGKCSGNGGHGERSGDGGHGEHSGDGGHGEHSGDGGHGECSGDGGHGECSGNIFGDLDVSHVPGVSASTVAQSSQPPELIEADRPDENLQFNDLNDLHDYLWEFGLAQGYAIVKR